MDCDAGRVEFPIERDMPIFKKGVRLLCLRLITKIFGVYCDQKRYTSISSI